MVTRYTAPIKYPLAVTHVATMSSSSTMVSQFLRPALLKMLATLNAMTVHSTIMWDR